MSSSEVPLPAFLIIGAQKSGTRWLRVNLGSHPDVYAAPHETQFFHSSVRFASLGLDWYRAQFPGWVDEPIVGEATPGYMMWRHRPRRVAQRIAEVVPDARLIAILRNPVDRAYSAMVHFEKRGKGRGTRRARARLLPAGSSLLEVVRQRPPERDPLCLVAGGWYAASLRPYQQLFGDQLLVLLHDDLTDNPRRVYKQALQHIGAAPDFLPSDLGTVLFSNQQPNVADSDEASNGTMELSIDERQQLFAYFRDDVRTLEEMIGRDLSEWDPGGTYSVSLEVDPWKEPPRRRPRRPTIDVVRCYEEAASWIEGIVRAVSSEQYTLPTPCAKWNVHDLLTRIIWLPYLSAAILRGNAHPPVDESDFVGGDATGAYRAAADEFLTAMSEAERLDRRVASPFGDMSGRLWARFALVNQVTHGWDLATATGEDATIPPSLLEAADRWARGLFGGMPRTPELFDVEVPVSDAATPTERFVAFLGRGPGVQQVESAPSG
jgi:uncharacterized protein (TIGR03086 family)